MRVCRGQLSATSEYCSPKLASFRVGQGIAQLALRVFAHRGLQGKVATVPAFRPGLVDEPVADVAGRKGQKGAAACLIPQDGFIKGKHCDAERILVSMLDRLMGEAHRLGPDKGQILPDQGVGGFGILLGGVDRLPDVLVSLYHRELLFLVRAAARHG